MFLYLIQVKVVRYFSNFLFWFLALDLSFWVLALDLSCIVVVPYSTSCSVIIPLLFTKLANKARGMCPVDAFSFSGSGTSKHAGNWNLEDDASTCSVVISAVGMFIVCKVFLPSTRSKPSNSARVSVLLVVGTTRW